MMLYIAYCFASSDAFFASSVRPSFHNFSTANAFDKAMGKRMKVMGCAPPNRTAKKNPYQISVRAKILFFHFFFF